MSPSETEIVAGRPDLPRVYPAFPAPIIVYEKVAAIGEAPQGELEKRSGSSFLIYRMRRKEGLSHLMINVMGERNPMTSSSVHSVGSRLEGRGCLDSSLNDSSAQEPILRRLSTGKNRDYEILSSGLSP